MLPALRCLVAGLSLASVLALAQALAPSQLSYWVSMRGITEDAQASFVAATYAPSGAYTNALAACGHSYYLTPADAATVQTARTAGDTVQVHAGNPGTTSAQSRIVCLVQADQ